MNKLILLLCFFALVSIAKAQDPAKNAKLVVVNNYDDDDESAEWLNNRIGMYASFFSGYGLSYQRQFDNDFSVKTQLFAYGSTDDTEESYDEVRAAFGLDVQYNLKKYRDTRVYALAGAFIDYYETGSNYYYYENTIDKATDIERYTNVGVGFGMEFLIFKYISCVLEGGYYGRFGNNSMHQYNGVNYSVIEKTNPKTFGFGGGVGVFFAF